MALCNLVYVPILYRRREYFKIALPRYSVSILFYKNFSHFFPHTWVPYLGGFTVPTGFTSIIIPYLRPIRGSKDRESFKNQLEGKFRLERLSEKELGKSRRDYKGIKSLNSK